jgi:hypothetical protein
MGTRTNGLVLMRDLFAQRDAHYSGVFDCDALKETKHHNQIVDIV